MNFIKPLRGRLRTVRGAILMAGLVAVFATVSNSDAQVAGKTIKAIDVQYVGNASVSQQRILSNMSSRVGDKLSPAKIDDDVKALYASGDVENVKILSESANGGVRLIVVVQTRASYGGVEFRGNSLIDSDKLRKKVELTVNKSIDEGALQEARKEIQDMYRKKGFSEVTVTYRIGAATSEGYSKVIFTIDEGTQGVLRDVSFVGNSAFTEAELRDAMSQKEKGIKTLFGKGGSTDSSSLADDVRAIEDKYRDEGYLNARVVNVAKMRADAKYVDVVITIDEGDTYVVESLAIKGVQSISLQEEILPYLKTKAGDRFSGAKLKDDLKLIGDQYGSKGYAEARVSPRLEEAGGGVRVVLDVSEGKQFKIGQVHIEGNEKTFDRVIRRELPLEPGQPYDSTRIDVTERRLENMNYFSSVEIMPLDTSYLDEKDLLIRVTEKPTGTINLGAGFSSIDSITGFLEVTQTNFDLFGWDNDWTGAGQRFRMNLRGGNERRDFSISITEPWFLEQRLALTVEAFYRDLLFLSDQYDQTNYGVSVDLRKSLGEFTYGVLKLSGEQINIDAESNASQAFLNEDGDFTKISLGLDLVNDTRDNIFLPRKGHKVSAGFEFAGLGGDVDDTIFNASAAKFFQLPYDGILSFSGKYSRSSNGDHLFTRHFLGGANNLRGFDYRDVGMRDPVSNEVLGGTEAYYGTAEVTFPVVEKIRLAAFYDIGEVVGGPGTVGGGLSSDYGIGARLFVLGSAPVRLDYAIPQKADIFNDGGGRFNFTIGAQF